MRLDCATVSTFEVISGKRAIEAKGPLGDTEYERHQRARLLGGSWRVALAAAVTNGGRVAVSCPAIEAVQESVVRGSPSEISQGKCARSKRVRGRRVRAA